MKHYTLVRIGAVALILALAGGITVRACPQDDPQPLDDMQMEDSAVDNQELPEGLPEVPGDVLNLRPKPPVEVDKRVVGWQQAGWGSNGGRLGSQLSANWVMLNETSGIDGLLVGVSEPVTVNLLRGGFLVAQVTTDEFGAFRFESATPGTYTIVGSSLDSLFIFGFLAVERTNISSDIPLTIEPLPASGMGNVRMISRFIREYAPQVRFDPYGIYDVGEAVDDPPQFYGWDGLKYLNRETTPATTIRHHAVAIVDNGRMVGRIHQVNNKSGRPVEVRNTEIKILQDGELIAETQTDVLGVFEIIGLLPGDYALIAVGADGIATIGLELVESSSVTGRAAIENLSRHRQVSYTRRDGPPVFDALLADPEATGWINAYVQEQDYERAMRAPRPDLSQMPYDYFSYPDGVGGGAAGGDIGGGFGELLLLGAFGVAIADAARTETFFGGPIPIVSPFNP